MGSSQRRLGRLIIMSSVVLLICALIPAAVVAAGGVFTDDDTSVFESDIEWLASSGVTLGCNPPANDMYCPEGNVTRAQMAAFMHRFAKFLDAEDGQVAAADYAVNANTVDGLDAADLIRINGTATDTSIDHFGASTWTDIQSASIQAPVDGVLLVIASTGLEDDHSDPGDSLVFLRLAVDGTPVHDYDLGYRVSLTEWPVEPWATVTSINAAVAVTQGQHTVSLQAYVSGDIYVEARSVSVIFSAFGGGVSSIPVGAGETGTYQGDRYSYHDN